MAADELVQRSRIRVLPERVRLLIAAGEVVERPASVVKELIDNAIDAGATKIRIEVRDGGLKLIRVMDDGAGMHRDDLELAFTRHATSKITSGEDLEQLVTMGFRGEALASIAAVARVELLTRTGEEDSGWRYIAEAGCSGSVSAAAAPPGTRLSVYDLFANVPARRKFVRSLRAESGHVSAVVMQYALARPDVQFTLAVDGSEAFNTQGSGELRDAAVSVFGPDVATHLLNVTAESAGISVRGLTGDPRTSKQNRSGIYISINGRPVANKSLTFALEQAYSGYLMVGRHPVAAVALTLPSSDVDANVHPSKLEVRFAREREVHGVLYRAVADAVFVMPPEARPIDLLAAEGQPVDQPLRATFTSRLAGEPEMQLDVTVPVLRVFGQSNQTFIVAEGPEGLYMIDQHAAHERILFDKFDALSPDVPVASQPLLEPICVQLTPQQIEALEAHHELLLMMGFDASPFGTESCLVRAVPALPRGESSATLVAEILQELVALPEPASARQRALASLACHAAVKAGQDLDLQEMREIVLQLERTARPQTCPHGRPTMIHLSHSQLEREFGRR